MNFYYKLENKSYEEQTSAQSKNDVSRNSSEIPIDLEQNIINLRNSILNSFSNNNQEQFYFCINELNQVLTEESNSIYELKIIDLIWNPILCKCLLESLHFCLNLKEGTKIPPECISNTLFLFAKLLKTQHILDSNFISLLTEDTFKILSISKNYINIIEESLHVLLKTCQFFRELPAPYDLQLLFTFFKDVYNKSELCEIYVSRFLKKIIMFFVFSRRKICDLFYFILKNPKSQKSIKHIMISLKLLLRCDIRYLEIIFQSKILHCFRQYYEKNKKMICTECPCFLIPFFDFMDIVVYYGEYFTVFKIFKILEISFFKELYRNKSDPQIQYYILYIFITHLKKLYYTDEKIREREIKEILDLFKIVVLSEFDNNDFFTKKLTIKFSYILLKNNKENTSIILLKKRKIFFDKFSYFVFNSNDDKTLKYYLKMLDLVFDYDTKTSMPPDSAFIQYFYRYKLDDQINDLINDNMLEEQNNDMAKYLISQITETKKQYDNNPKQNNINEILIPE